jgi:hypothetical protein
MVGGCFTDVVLHSFGSCHNKHALITATEPRRLHKDDQAACGTIIYVSTEFSMCKAASTLIHIFVVC